jgi:hypothetical protein
MPRAGLAECWGSASKPRRESKWERLLGAIATSENLIGTVSVGYESSPFTQLVRAISLLDLDCQAVPHGGGVESEEQAVYARGAICSLCVEMNGMDECMGG